MLRLILIRGGSRAPGQELGATWSPRLDAAVSAAPTEPSADAPPSKAQPSASRAHEIVRRHPGAQRRLARFRPGEIRAICGENGAGKSTLVKILTGVYQPDAGTLTVGGTRAASLTPRQAQERGIALVAQELSLCPDLSVEDNIWLGSVQVPFFHKQAELRRRARAALDRLGAGHIGLDTAVGALAIGERQLIEIARMLTREARVLILDEPTATLVGFRDRPHLRRTAGARARGPMRSSTSPIGWRKCSASATGERDAQRRAGGDAPRRRDRPQEPDRDDARPQLRRDVSGAAEGRRDARRPPWRTFRSRAASNASA